MLQVEQIPLRHRPINAGREQPAGRSTSTAPPHQRCDHQLGVPLYRLHPNKPPSQVTENPRTARRKPQGHGVGREVWGSVRAGGASRRSPGRRARARVSRPCARRRPGRRRERWRARRRGRATTRPRRRRSGGRGACPWTGGADAMAAQAIRVLQKVREGGLNLSMSRSRAARG